MFGETPLVMVEDDAKLREVVEHLSSAPVIGLDTESDSFHHYQEKVCLIQISDLTQDYIIDPLAVPDLTPLRDLLEREDQVVVVHGGDYDVVCLRRDFDIQLRNLFDTMISAQFLGMEGVGLASLIRRYFGHKIDKKYQRHDWSERPLLPEHLDYARGDTHWLPTLMDVLTLRLRQAGRLDAALEEARLLEDRQWTGRARHESDFMRVKQAKTLDTQGRRVLRAVWEYREEQARRIDRPAHRVIPDRVLLLLSEKQPTTPEALHSMVRAGSPLVRRHGRALLEAVKAGLADERPIPTPPPNTDSSKAPRRRSGGAGQEKLMLALKDWRNRVVKKQSLAPVVVASNNLLREIARVAPTTMEELSQVQGIRRWQVADFGQQILDVVAGVPAPAPKKRRRRRRSSASD